jgi:hypothetical protein
MFESTNNCPIYVPAESVDAYKTAQYWNDYARRIRAITPEAVDLGLSVKWASFNLGASSPEEYGDYFAWGETETKSIFDWDTYKFSYYAEGWEDKVMFNKYITASDNEYGTVDNKTTLEAEDDAASVRLGGNWRMPTDVEFSELWNYCSSKMTNMNGVYGCIVTGSNGNSIFLPAAGFRYGADHIDKNYSGDYWSSSLSTENPLTARSWYFFDGFRKGKNMSRTWGLQIRPVCD